MWTTCLSHVDKVFYLLFQYQCFLKQSKCAFGILELEYLGHIVSKDGVRVDPKKLKPCRIGFTPKLSRA